MILVAFVSFNLAYFTIVQACLDRVESFNVSLFHAWEFRFRVQVTVSATNAMDWKYNKLGWKTLYSCEIGEGQKSLPPSSGDKLKRETTILLSFLRFSSVLMRVCTYSKCLPINYSTKLQSRLSKRDWQNKWYIFTTGLTWFPILNGKPDKNRRPWYFIPR